MSESQRAYWKEQRQKAKQAEQEARGFFLQESRKRLDIEGMIPQVPEIEHTISPEGQIYQAEAQALRLKEARAREEKERLQREKDAIEKLRKLDEIEFEMHREEFEPYIQFFVEAKERKRQ